MRREHAERWRDPVPFPDSPSPFGATAAGLQDFRGAPLTHLTHLEGMDVRSGDFSGADLRHLRITDCSFKDCIFDRTNLADAKIKSCDFENCEFLKTDLRIAHIGMSGSSFSHCRFGGVRVARAAFGNPIFQRIVFHGRDWQHVDFRASGFWNCAFTGEVRGVTFRGDYQFPSQREMHGRPIKTGLHSVSFEDAELYWVGLTNGCILENIVLPKTGSAFICGTATLLDCEKLLASVICSDRFHNIEGYFKIVRVHAPLQPARFVSRNDLIDYLGDDEGSEFYNILQKCIQEREGSGAIFNSTSGEHLPTRH